MIDTFKVKSQSSIQVLIDLLSLGHVIFFRRSGVQAYDTATKFQPSTLSRPVECDDVGQKKCRWSKFHRTDVRLYVNATEGT